jgi:cytochrome P450 family 142 subfamily A polypeptide 1
MTAKPMTVTPSNLDLLDGALYTDGHTYETYAWYRKNQPVAWDSINELWGVFRYDDIVRVERDKTTFISSDQNKGGYRPNTPADPSIIGLDDPMHSKRRNLVSRRFTPRAIADWAVTTRAEVNELLDHALAKPTVEIVGELASVLPAKMIGRLLGFPPDSWPELREWSEKTIALGGGPRYYDESGIAAAMQFYEASSHLYEEKQRCPADDVMSVWTTAQVEGRDLTIDEVRSDCLLLLDGGAETTRTVIARTMLALAANTDQWELLRAGADMTVATEEFIRTVTPVHNMCRVATTDAELAGSSIKAGQQLVMMYGSANRDEAQFSDPELFDVTRSPNNHLSFGFGTHFCLGAALARQEIRVFFEELVKRVRELRLLSEEPVVEMPNAFVFGLKAATMELVPA